MKKEDYDLAWKYLDERDYDEAQKICDELLSQNKNDYKANYLSGHIALEQNNHKEALRLFLISEKHAQNENLLGFIKYWIGNIYNTRQYKKIEEFYDKEKAISYFKESMKYPFYPTSVINSLVDYEDEISKKIELYDIGINKFPDNPEFYLKKSYIYNNRIKDIQKYYEILQIGLDKTNSNSIKYLLGEYNYNRADFNSALDYFKEILNNDKRKRVSFAMNIAIANCYYKLEDYVKAREHYKRSEEFAEGSEFIYSLIGQIMSNFNEEPNTNFSNYFERLIFTDDIFEFYYEFIMFWIDDHHDLQLAFDAKNVLSTLTKISNKSFSEIQKNKYLLLKCIVLTACERYRELVLNLRKLVDNLNYDWIEKKLSNEYYNYLEQTIKNNGSLLQFISYLKSDLAKYPRLRIFLIQNSMGYIIDKLHSEKYYKEVVDLYNIFESKELDKINKWFDFAHSLKDQNHAEKAQHAYEIEIKNNPKSSAALNNLGVIFEENGDLEKAVFYFEKARSINQNEELYKRNLTRVSQLLSEKETKDRIFYDALDKLKYETDYAIEKLNNFISAAKKDETYDSGELPIPSWKFAQLISANSQIANLLKDQWINKGYIFDTGERDEYRVKIYSINPLLEEHLLEIKTRRLDDSWIRGISEIGRAHV